MDMFAIINQEIQNVPHLKLNALIIMYMDMMSQQIKKFVKIYILLVKHNVIMEHKGKFVKI